MGNALWTGVRLKDVLDKAGVKSGAVQVRFKGLEEPVVADAPHFMKSLDITLSFDGLMTSTADIVFSCPIDRS
jgi:DMSO/TMAO reductase YedYZ molybdopterin-dependent catalytic subunit